MIAWRAWGLEDLSKPVLLSPARGTPWPAMQVMRAQCSSCPIVPGPLCDCGIHAVRTAAEIRTVFATELTRFRFLVFGQVALSGTVLEGPVLRAESAYPVSLVLIDKPWVLDVSKAGVVDGLSRNYDVPVDCLRWAEFFTMSPR